MLSNHYVDQLAYIVYEKRAEHTVLGELDEVTVVETNKPDLNGPDGEILVVKTLFETISITPNTSRMADGSGHNDSSQLRVVLNLTLERAAMMSRISLPLISERELMLITATHHSVLIQVATVRAARG